MVISKPNLSLIEMHLKKIAIPRDPFQNLRNLKNTQDYAAETLRKMGYENVKSLAGGCGGWVDEDYEFDGELLR